MDELRIISLIASATEIVCALGFENSMVGRSHECDYPPSIKILPVCTSTKFNTEGASYEIDERVKAIVQEGLSVYRVSAELLEELKPSHIITQTQCEVCAVSLRDVEEAVCKITSSRPAIVSLEPNSLADIWSDIRRVGNALGDGRRAEELITHLQERMNEIAQRAQLLQERPKVACIEWIDPLMSTGNWMPELVRMAGGINLFGEAGKHSPWMTWEELVAADPEIIVIMPCGFDIERTIADMPALTVRSEWKNLKAVRTSRIFIADGNQYFNRPGPRLVESLQILAELFHPDIFQFGHENLGWMRIGGR
jgi:iron complex transport system substrate-binding protein